MLNLSRKYTLAILCVLALTFGALPSLGIKSSIFTINAQVESNSDIRRYEFVPDYILYRTLFHTIFLLNGRADEAERLGQVESARAFRRVLRQDMELNEEQITNLNRIAAECEQAVRAVDARAYAIIKARRSHYPDDTLRAGQQPLPPSPELEALQQERNVAILRCRNSLQEAFRQTEWERFRRSVPSRIAPNIQIGRAKSIGALMKARFEAASQPAQTQGESIITGSTLISYDAFTNLVTAVSTTELDYSAQDWYMGRVSSSLRDVNGNTLASGSANDTDRDGTASVTMQTAGQDQMTYSARGVYGARPEIQDFNMGSGWYIDHWNYQEVIRGAEGGTSYYIYMPFYGRGPSRRTRLRNLLLGETNPATVQSKPRVESKKPTLSDPDIVVDTVQGTENESTDVITEVQASSEGLQAGDRVKVEIIISSGNSSAVTFANGGVQVTTVDLTPGGNVLVTFKITGVSEAGTYTFTTRITDVRRSDGQGGFNSIFSRVTTNDAGIVSDPLTVRNPTP